MLVLQRRIGERIFIGDDVVITLVGYNGHQVKIGIEAPRHVLIDREEVRAKIEGIGHDGRARALPRCPKCGG